MILFELTHCLILWCVYVYEHVIDCWLQVEIQVSKIYCVNKALPTLPINIEDAARSEAEIEAALQVHFLLQLYHLPPSCIEASRLILN